MIKCTDQTGMLQKVCMYVHTVHVCMCVVKLFVQSSVYIYFASIICMCMVLYKYVCTYMQTLPHTYVHDACLWCIGTDQ